MDRLLSPVDVLLVEDNPDDVEILKMAIEAGGIKSRLTVARDGQEALDILRGGNGAPRPSLIFLDLNLPKVKGLDVLREIKADPSLQHIPVIILTASTLDKDVINCYELGANSFVSKSANLEDFLEAIKTILEYWLVYVTLPSEIVTSEAGRS